MIVTLQDLILNAKRYADLEKSSLISDDEWVQYINFGVQKYWTIINELEEDYNLTEVYLQTQQNQSDLDLPTDFLQLRGLDIYRLTSDGINFETGDENYLPISAYDFKERLGFSPLVTVYNNSPYSMRFRLFSGKLRIYPTPPASLWLRLSYIPTAPDLISDSDTINGYDGLSEYIAAWGALRAIKKDAGDPSVVQAVIQNWEEAMRAQLLDRNRDIGDRVTDVYLRNQYFNNWY